jgi:4a-hydroxytetrahydrobiopterin dehydratase
MPNDLAKQHCVPLPRGTAPLQGKELESLAAQVPEWTIVEGHHLHRAFRFPDFASALAFVNRVGAVAEAEQHHPDITLGWGKVEISTHTHSIDGLSRNDFILAAKIEDVLAPA